MEVLELEMVILSGWGREVKSVVVCAAVDRCGADSEAVGAVLCRCHC